MNTAVVVGAGLDDDAVGCDVAEVAAIRIMIK